MYDDLKSSIARYSSPEEQLQLIMNDIYYAQTDNPTRDSLSIAQNPNLTPEVINALMDIVFSKHFRVIRSLTVYMVSVINNSDLVKAIIERIIKEKIFINLTSYDNSVGYHIRSLIKFIDVQKKIDKYLLEKLYFNCDLFMQDQLSERDDFPADLLMDLYNKTNNEKYLPKNIKDIFIF